MAMPYQPWRAKLQPASFAGCGFKVEQGSRPGGRRLALHEYPKGDKPYTEDMGRKAVRWQITGYCIGPDYLDARDAIIAASNREGPFTLVHPSFGDMQVHCDTCVPTETREKGGFCAFEMVFFEAGQNPDAAATADTQAQVGAAADSGNDATAAAGRSTLGGIGSDAVAGGTASTSGITGIGGGVGGISPGAGSGDFVYPVTTPAGSGGIGSA